MLASATNSTAYCNLPDASAPSPSAPAQALVVRVSMPDAFMSALAGAASSAAPNTTVIELEGDVVLTPRTLVGYSLPLVMRGERSLVLRGAVGQLHRLDFGNTSGLLQFEGNTSLLVQNLNTSGEPWCSWAVGHAYVGSARPHRLAMHLHHPPPRAPAAAGMADAMLGSWPTGEDTDGTVIQQMLYWPTIHALPGFNVRRQAGWAQRPEGPCKTAQGRAQLEAPSVLTRRPCLPIPRAAAARRGRRVHCASLGPVPARPDGAAGVCLPAAGRRQHGCRGAERQLHRICGLGGHAARAELSQQDDRWVGGLEGQGQ